MQVNVNRGACCHVAGDIDFDKNNNLWMVTGDDTPAGGGNSGGFGPFNDQKTNETQTFRVTNATGGTFTLTFNGQTTAAIPYNATAAEIQTALEDAQQHRRGRHPRRRRPGPHRQRDGQLPRSVRRAERQPRSRGRPR